ncbi:hypothetical protein GCM10009710_14080 [Aeromicrobium alkaliterrae]|uniref:Imelysin-like domain-containing protein n=1 Tax=Aeromicrobium alkaliterrae TaxID=302168 RepID=A0ABN2JPR1_9ACTN
MLVAGCSDPEPPPNPSPAPPANAEPAGACSDVLDGRDADVVAAAQDASFEVLTAAISQDTPAEDDLAAWSDALAEGLDQLDAEIEALRGVSDEEAWETVLAPLEERASTYEERIALAEGSWPVDDSDDLAAPAETAGLTEALEELDLVGRDCETLLGDPGPNPEFSDFVVAVAGVCSVVVERRSELGFQDLLGRSLEIVLAVRDGEPVQATDDDLAAVRALRDEWSETVDDLALVDEDAPDPAAWAEATQLAQDRLDAYTQRLAALESGDRALIVAAFDPGVLGVPGWPWDALGLAQRDCRSVEA